MDSSQSDSLSPTTNPTGFSGPNMNMKNSGSHHSSNNTNIFPASSNSFRFGDHENDEYMHPADTPKSGSRTAESFGFVETTKAVVCDSVATNNKQLLLANLYHYFVENKNYRSAISLLKESEVPIMIPDKKTIKINIFPREQNNPSKDKKLIYKINHPEGEIELYENEYLTSQASIPSNGSFLLQWWECLWSLYNFVNTQPLELVTSIRPFIDVIQPIFSENNFAMSGMANLKSPVPSFFNQSSPANGYPPSQPSLKKSSVATQPKTPFGFDNSKVQQFSNSQRIPKETSSSSSPFPYSDNLPQSSMKPKYPYNENDVEYIKNAQEYASGGNISKYQNSNQFQKRMSKSHYPIPNKSVTSATSAQYYSPSNTGTHHVQANIPSFNGAELDNSKTAMAANPGDFNSKPDAKFYPQDGVFRPVSNGINNNNNNTTNNNQKLSPLNDQATSSSEANMYQQVKRSASTNIPIPSPHVPMMPQSITGQSPQVAMIHPSKQGQSPHVNINHQYPVNQFANIPQIYNQQNSFNNNNSNNVTQQPSKDSFNQNFMDAGISQRSPYPQQPINQPQAINKISSAMAPPQKNTSVPIGPNTVNSFNGNMGLNEQQQLMMQMQMQMKSGNFPPSLNGQQGNQQFNGNNMQGIVPNMMQFMNNSSQNNVNYKMSQYPTIPEGVRFNMTDMQPMANNQLPSSNTSVNQNAGSSSSGDWGMGSNDNYAEPKSSSKRKKSKTLSTPSNITTPTGSYPIYSNPAYQQALMTNGSLNNSATFHSQNNTGSGVKSMAVIKPKQQRGRKPKAGSKASAESNYNSPYTPVESPLGSSDKQVKKNVTRKKRTKKSANAPNTDTRKNSNSNFELMGHFAEATFLTARTSQGVAANGTNESEYFVPTAISGDNENSANFVQKTNSINHKNDIVDSLMNGDDFGLKFLSASTKGQDSNVHGNASAKYEAAGNNLEDDDMLLKSFLMDEDNFGGLDFNLDHNSADVDHS